MSFASTPQILNPSGKAGPSGRDGDPKKDKELKKERKVQEKKEKKEKKEHEKSLKEERKKQQKLDTQRIEEQSKRVYETSAKATPHKKQSTWSNIKRLNNALSNGLLDDIPDSSKIVATVLKNPSAMLFMASSPITFRLIERRDLMKEIVFGHNYVAVMGNMTELKAVYAEVERRLDEEDARAGKRRDIKELSDRQRDMVSQESFQVQQLGCYLQKKDTDLIEQLASSWKKAIAQHDLLRAIGMDSAMQFILRKEPDFPLERRTVSSVSNFRHEVESFMNADRTNAFDLTNQRPLVRFALLSANERDHFFLWSFHSILFDRPSALHIFRQVFAAEAVLKNSASPSKLENLPSAPHVTAASVDEEAAFWRTYLSGSSILPLDRIATLSRQLTDTVQMQKERQKLDLSTIKSVEKLASQYGVRAQTLALAAWAVVLHRWTGEHDMLIGLEMPHLPSTHPSASSTTDDIGNFTHVFPVRVRVRSEMSFLDLVKDIDRTVLALQTRSPLSFSHIQEISGIQFDLTEMSTVTTYDESAAPELNLAPHVRELVDNYVNSCPLAFRLINRASSKELEMDFESTRIERYIVQSLLGNVSAVLRASGLQAMEKLQIAAVPLLSESDIDLTMVQWNNTNVAHSTALVHQLFEQQVLATPTSTAVLYSSPSSACAIGLCAAPSPPCAMSYEELNRRANRLAWHLRSTHNVGVGNCVGIFLPRSAEMYVCIFALLKLGAAYLPLDTELPKDRLKFIVKDCKASHVLTRSEYLSLLKVSKKCTAIVLNQVPAEVFATSSTMIPSDENLPPVRVPSTELLMYVRYTSGSTGHPKGVEILHNGVVNFVAATKRAIPSITSKDTYLALSTLSFDISELEYLIPLTSGAKLYVVPPDVNTDGRKLKEELKLSGATVMQATPATWQLLLDAQWDGDKKMKVLCGGEPMTHALATKLVSRIESLWNLYGPTECSVWTSVRQITAQDLARLPPTQSMPVGGPVANTQFYLLDENKQPVPRGAMGELYIGGESVGKGYKRSQFTKERFIANPLVGGPYPPNVVTSSSRLYRTGDVLRLREDGSMQFVSRVDFQVKIRGFRIELGEIEATIGMHSDIAACVVTVFEPLEGDKRLIAYVRPKRSDRPLPSVDQLREFAASKLPKYMVPAAFIPVEKFALNANNKVNRKALPIPTAEQLNQLVMRSGRAFVAPRDEVEARVAEIFQEVLSVSPIGVNDDFFELGGQSMLGVHLIGAIEIALNVTVPFSSILAHSTVEGLSTLVREQRLRADSPQLSSPLVALQPKGTRPPLFCVHPAFNSCLCYGGLAHHLGADQPFYGLEPKRKYDTLVEMAADYVAAIRKQRPLGPYHIMGWSFGCTVAYEMAWQLRRDGFAVELFLIDGRAPIHTAEDLARDNDALQLVVMFRGLKHYLGKALLLSYTKLAELPEDKRLFYVMDQSIKGKVLPENLAPEVGIAFFTRFRSDFVENEELLRAYHPQKYGGKLTLLRAEEHYLIEGVPDPLIDSPAWGWEKLVSSPECVEVVSVPGDHDTLIFKPFVEGLAERLASTLRFRAMEELKDD